MNIGLIGLRKSGKTTIFNALTGRAEEVSEYVTQKMEPNMAVVDVLDSRVTELSAMYQPKKTVYANIEVVDFAGLSAGAAEHGVFSGEAMARVKTTDALAIVLRNFADPVVDETYGAPNPTADVESITTELILADQIVAERRLERIRSDLKRGKKTPTLAAEEKTIERVVARLNDGLPLAGIELTEDENRLISGFQFVSAKPVFVVLNSSEDRYGRSAEFIESLAGRHDVVEFAGKFEMELTNIDDEDERQVFMDDIGITESAISRLTTFAYEKLGYISFFTVGSDEVRAWTIRVGESALDAAGTIHSDLARGFIRAEVFSYEDVINLGSEKAVKEKGKFRLEGKSYVVHDGDILHVRFSV